MALELDHPRNRNYIQTLELLAGVRKLPAVHGELVAWLRTECGIPALNLGQSVFEQNRLTIIVATIGDRLAAVAAADPAPISAQFHSVFQRHLAATPLPADFPRARPVPNEPMDIQILDMESVGVIDAHDRIAGHDPAFTQKIQATFAGAGIARIETLDAESHIVCFETGDQLSASFDSGLRDEITLEFLRHLRPHDPTATLTAQALTITFDSMERQRALFGDRTHLYFR